MRTLRSIISAAFAAIALLPVSLLFAQGQQIVAPSNPPPSIETRSPGDVDLGSGAYTMSVVDLQIGEGPFPNGLTLERSYNSSSDEYYSYRAGFASQGWSHNWMMHMTTGRFRSGVDEGLTCPIFPNPSTIPDVYDNPLCEEYYHVLVLSNQSAKFSNGVRVPEDFQYLPDGFDSPLQILTWTGLNFPSIYHPIEEHNKSQQLEFIGSLSDPDYHTNGNYEFTDADGTKYVFHPGVAARLSHVIAPNGVTAQVYYGTGRQFTQPKAVITSNGYALLFEYQLLPSSQIEQITKACVVNLGITQVNPGDPCPQGAQSVTYGYNVVAVTPPPFLGRPDSTYSVNVLTSATSAIGETTTYGYDDRRHIACIRDPGQSVCRLEIQYNRCGYSSALQSDPSVTLPDVLPSEMVMRQSFATGERLTYSTFGTMTCPPEGETVIGFYSDALGNQVNMQMAGGKALSMTDPLGRVTSATYTSLGDPFRARGTGLLTSQTFPEGNRVELSYNDRGLIIEQRVLPKPGSGNPTLVTSTSYPADCTSTTRKTCNQPTSVTDAKGNVTTFTYDPAHGGVMTMTAPAVGGVSPITRYYYVQREAWVRSGAGYAKTGKPVWLKSEERSCRTSTLDPVAGTCSAGAGDLVRTLYDYGPEAGPNNLWLRGMAVVADGQTLRTCYQYDQLGRRVAETKPLGTGATCP
jgi:YD repeat-containing protein